MGSLPLHTTPQQLADRATRGPRYTSYPPAPHFGPDFGAKEAETRLKALKEVAQTEGISLYTHIPFCSQLCWYCGCNVKITRDRSRGTRYADVLLREMQLYAEVLPGATLAELSLGGGSPNFLDPAALQTLTQGIAKAFPLQEDALLGIELDPRDTTTEQIKTLAGLGYRRLSVGVQDFEERVQATINRKQSREATEGLIEEAKREGFTSVGVDLVYGLPGQTCESFSSTVQSLLEIRPDRLALFGYAHMPHLRKHQKLVEREPIPDLRQRAELLTLATKLMCEAGYTRVGFDHFALENDPLAKAVRSETLHRNFQGFTVPRGGPLLACGVTGISDIGDAYWQNLTDLEEWETSIQAGRLPIARGLALGEDDRIRRYLINRILCDSQLSFQDIEHSYGVRFSSYFAWELARLQEEDMQDLVVLDLLEGRLGLTEMGFELVRNVCMVFDRYLRGKSPAGSTTI